MKIVEIRYEKKVNCGNYEHELLSSVAVLEDNDNFSECVAKLRKQVNDELSGQKVIETKSEPKVSETKSEVIPPKAPKSEPKKEKKAKAEEKKEEGEWETVKDDTKEEEKSAPKAEPKKEEPKKEKAAKPIPYNRSIEQHRKDFIEAVNTVEPSWKETLGPVVKQVSLSVEGMPFYDVDGNVMDSFKKQVKELLDAGKQEAINDV